MPARPASSASESDPCESRKGHRKDREKTKEKDKKSKKEKSKKEKRGRSESPAEGAQRGRSRERSRRRAPEPDFAPSGLLAQVGASGAPPKLQLGPQRPAGREGERSRSRDDHMPPPRMGAHPLDRDDGKGDGKGKGKGKDKGEGKGGQGGQYGGEGEPPEPMEEPNFEASGLLAMEDNSKNGVPLKYTMPSDSRRPTFHWRFYVFSKQNEAGKILHVHRQAGYLFGKDRRVADVPTDHPTCSKQHAVLHYRMHRASGEVRPYIMDLESTNGTHLNGERIEPARYYEVKQQDKLKFGLGSREFVLLHTGSVDGVEG